MVNKQNRFGTKRGWFSESRRHALARQGITTKSNPRMEDKLFSNANSNSNGEKPEPKPTLSKRLLQTAKKAIRGNGEEARRIIEEVGTKREIEELKKDMDDIRVEVLSDKSLEELAVRSKPSLFGSNRFENEIIRRVTERDRIQVRKFQEKKRLETERKRISEGQQSKGLFG